MITTPSTASQAPEVLTKQVAAWRAEVARLNDLIEHATGASQETAVSISHDTELQSMLNDAYALATDAYACGNDFGTIGKLGEAEDKIFAYFDAKLAQARQGALAEADIIHKDLLATMSESGKIWQHRATAAEAKLEAIRQGFSELKMWETAHGSDVYSASDIDDIRELLQQQPQADESGLPG